MTLALLPHPAAQTPSPVRVEATAAREGSVLRLAYVVTGELARLRLPLPAEPERDDELWRSTCMEAFVSADGLDGYVELNLSPSLRWAAYAFDGYRSGMRDADLVAPPRVQVSAKPDRLDLHARVDLTGLLPQGAPWRLGLSAVIKFGDDALAYLALAHAPDKPDFHHPAGYVLELTADA